MQIVTAQIPDSPADQLVRANAPDFAKYAAMTPEQIAQDPEVQALKQQLDAEAPKPKRKTKGKERK